ncbi:MAG TPA: stage III sporulation protein AC [Firmicutes bacterium]|nr:stage III sporulation protein AC [Bacillota bacterium]
MQVELIMQLAGLGLLTAVAHSVLKQAGKEEMAQLVTLAGVVIGLVLVLELIARLFNNVRTLFGL